MKKSLVSVLIPSYIKSELLYIDSSYNMRAGDVVLIPLRNKTVVGVVWSKVILGETDYPLKTIISKIFELDEKTRNFIDSVAQCTLVNKGLVLRMVLGPLVKRHGIILKKFAANYTDVTHKITRKFTLSQEQQKVFDELISLKSKHIVSVIDGITGSGKTELYLQIAKNIIEDAGQVLILLPEILLTTQIIERAKQIFGCEVHPWHSNVKQKDKDQVWIGVQNQSVKIVIGARSALFLPFSNLQMIIVDEEHDIGFKQESNPIYNAKNMAILRSKISNIPIVLVSATPSIETMYHVSEGDYKYFYLKHKNFSEAELEVKIANMWEVQNKKEKNFPILHSMSIEAISKALQSEEQILMFLNRKGYAATTICTSCMSVIRCKNCDVKLTYYKHKQQLKCRHCGYIIAQQKTCTACGQNDSLFTYHPGIEKLHEELLQHFPEAKMLTVTRDSFENEDANDIIQKISNHEVDIVIGTQILAKGLHFPKMSLCIIVDANNTKFSGDIRAFERTHQIIQQVIGRVGRESKGVAIIQTLNKNSTIINSIISGNKKDFIKLELENRKAAKVPPYASFVLVSISSANEKKLHEWLLSITIPENTHQMKIFGPIPAAIYRIHNKYRYQILFKSEDQHDLLMIVDDWIKELIVPYYIVISIDVDPQSFH